MWGGLAVAIAMDLECDVYKQIEVIITDSLLPQEYEIEMLTLKTA